MPTLHWIGKDKVINHHLDVPYKVLEHQYGFGLAEPSEFGEVGFEDSRDLEADKIQQSTNPKNLNSDNHSSEFGEVGLTDSRDLEAAEIQQSTNPKNPNSDNHSSEFGKVGFEDLQDLEADKIEQSTNLKNPNSDNHSSEFGKVGFEDLQDLEADKIQSSTNPKNPNSDNHSNNKIIHGDNLEALKSLLPEYEGKIKCIYIDPPYNTGNESWVYNDNVNDSKIKKWLGNVVGKEAEDLTRHDKWLCMMYPRLKLLHKLLADDGAIFISIDDNEQANLKLLMDEIFGGGNFIVTIVWQKRTSPDARKKISSGHEYIAIYQKNSVSFRDAFNLLELDVEDKKKFKNPDNDHRGPWVSTDCTAQAGHGTKSQFYSLTTPFGRIITLPDSLCWRYTEDKMKEEIIAGRIWFGKDGKGVPRKKTYLAERNGKNLWSWWDNKEVGHSQEATKEIKEIFQNTAVFDYPKPLRLINRILQISTDKNSIILDSFAGTGTTAHAVLNLNKQDGGNRKFILIEMEAYAETITAERVKRVINGYGNTEGTGGSFDFYTLGEPLFLEDGLLNENLPLQKIRAYIWYTETQAALQTSSSENTEVAAFLGKNQNTAYYFYYHPQEITTLDHDFLASIKTKAEQYIIYADNCLLTPNYMAKNSIVFKKIPRDVTQF